jgi:tetratricopeptide (TPR) repeat protein
LFQIATTFGNQKLLEPKPVNPKPVNPKPSTMNILPSNRLRLYRDFKAIDANDYYGIVRYYELHEDGIRALELEEYLDCTLAYTNALFETGNHGQHIVMCDHLLEIVIMQNIETWGGEDLFERLLFRKAASLFQLHEYPKAEHVLRELVKIYPAEKLPRRFLEKCLLRQKPAWLTKTRATFIGLSLLAAIVIALEFFVIEPFFPSWLFRFQIAHNALLFSGIGSLVVGEGLHAWRCRRAIDRLVGRRRRRKKAISKG